MGRRKEEERYVTANKVLVTATCGDCGRDFAVTNPGHITEYEGGFYTHGRCPHCDRPHCVYLDVT